MPFDAARLVHYPELPGVYLMKDVEGVVIYVGKAKNLRARLRQYFATTPTDTRVQVPYLVAHAVDVETILTHSETEALRLEAELIRRFKPRYNVLLKDDRSGLCIRIGMEHTFPRVELVRKKEAAELPPKVFGPYERSMDARQLFDLVIRCFQLRQCSDDVFCRRTSPCLLHQLRKCTAPCVRKVSEEEYHSQVSAAVGLLAGKKSELKDDLYHRMQQASDSLEFERAGVFLRQLQLLESMTEDNVIRSQATDLCDVIGSWSEGSKLALCILHYRGPLLVFGESWAFDLEEAIPFTDYRESLLVQYYLQREAGDDVPREILFPEDNWDLKPFQEVLSEYFGKKVIARRPKVGVKCGYLELACDNAKARLAQMQVSSTESQLLNNLQRELSLRRPPRIIDCFDASHFSGKGLVAVAVSFVDGKKYTLRYRTFHIRETTVGDDLAMLKEAVKRRYHNKSDAEELPDMILVDGGKNQLRMVHESLQDLSVSDIDVVAIAKDQGRHDRGIAADVLFVEDRRVRLSALSKELQLLQKIRDESHRFAITFQKKQRRPSSCLDTVKGIGEKKKKRLLTAFRGIDEIKSASVEELRQRAGLNQKDAENVLKVLNNTLATKKL
jgi:excinuclease ABC subunit C